MNKRKSIMKRVLAIALAVATVLTTVPAIDLTESVKAADKATWDGTFEKGVIGRTVKGWTLVSADAKYEYEKRVDYAKNYQLLISGDSKSGTKALEISPKSGGTQGYVFAESELLDVKSATAYSLNYAIKVKGAEGKQFRGTLAYLTQYDKKGNELKRTQVGTTLLEDTDWSNITQYVQTEADTAKVKISYWVGGYIGKNKDLKVLVDNVEMEQLSESELLNGGFESGSGKNDIYSWHLTSKSIQNEPVEQNWAANYTMERETNGYHGDAVAVTRLGTGYVTLDSNRIKVEEGSTYIIDLAFRIQNVDQDFEAVHVYLAEYDKKGERLTPISFSPRYETAMDWTEFTGSYTPSKDAVYFQLEFWCGGFKESNFTANFDDVRITTIQRKTSADGVNNGNFEEVYDGAVFDWNLVKREDTSITPTFNGYNGTKGVYVVKTSEEKQGYAAMQSNYFDVVAGKDYKYSFMSRFEKQKGNVYIVVNVYFYDKNGERLEIIRDQEHDHRTVTSEWECEAGYVTAPKGATQARLEFLIAGVSYECWMDDVTWSTRDKEANVYGFDALDNKGNIAGWTVTQPAAAKADKKTFRQGTSSLFISHTLNEGYTEVTADELIPINGGVRYKFTMYLKSYDCNVGSAGIKMWAAAYDKEGKKVTTFEGTRVLLNEASEKSNWMELTLGVNNIAGNVAYIRPYIQIASGTVNVWLDDLSWKVWDVSDEFYEDFDSVRDDGAPDGWTATVVNGNPKFVTSDSVVRIEAPTDSDTGKITTKWKTLQEYISCDFAATYSTTAGTKAKVVIKFYDYKGTEIEKSRQEQILDATNGVYADTSFRFIMPAMTYAIIELSNEGAGTVAFEGLSITQNTEDTASAETDWRGVWIWHDEDYHDSENSTPRYFRYHVTLPDNPMEGNIQITADDNLRVWINGTEIIDDSMSEHWANISMIDSLTDYMTAGENVIAVSVTNFTSYAGLLFDGYVETENGEWVDIISTDTTVSSLVEYEGWQEKDYDDSAWSQAKIVEKVGGAQWGSDAIFDASALVQNIFEVEEYSLTEDVTAGNAVKLTMTVVPEKDIEGTMELGARLWVRNTERKVLDTELEQLDGPDISEWKAGKKVTVSYSFEIPDYIGSGKYALQLNTNQVKITNMEIIDNKFTQAIKVKNNAADKPMKTELVESNGTYAFSINGKVEPITMYTTVHRPSYIPTATADYMCAAGVCITRLWMTGGGRAEIWIGENEYDFDVLDGIIYDALSDHQDTYIMLTLGLQAPTWWKEANPDELTVTNEGTVSGESVASDKLAKESTEATLAMIEHMKEQPYWNRIIGSVLSGYNTHEWLWYGGGQTTIDYSVASQNKWKAWLTEKYGTDAELQKAWNNASASIEKATVPTFEERVSDTYTVFVDPATQQDAIDYVTYQGELIAQRLSAYAAAITEAVDDNWVLGPYNGYMNSHYHYGSVINLHTAISQTLEDENIDFMAAPVCYDERYDGEAAGLMWMIDGCLAAGKALIAEDDLRLCPWTTNTREFLTRDAVGPTFDVADSVSQVERNISVELVNNIGQWHFDIEPGLFSREQFSDVIEIGTNEFVVNLAREKDSTSDVCYIIDEDLYINLAADYWATYNTLYYLLKEQRTEFSKLGMTVDSYHLSDLEKGRVPDDYKIYFMISPVEIDEEEKAAIEKNLKKDGKVVVWQYICGASDGETFNAKNMSDMIGMDVTFDLTARNQSAVVSDKKHWLTEGQNGRFFGEPSGRDAVSPTAIVTDAKAEVLAYMSDDSNDAALAIKDLGDWTSIYSSVPTIPAEIIRNLLRKYDVHTYSENTNDAIFANSNYVAINCTYGGDKEITLDGTYAVYDVFNMTTYSLSTDKITINMEDNSTRLFRLTETDKHVVYVDVDNGGKSKQEGYQEVKPGKDYACTIKAKDGYVISGIIVDGELTEVTEKSYKVTFEDISNSHYVRAQFKKVSEELEEVVEETSPWTTIAWISATLLLVVIVIVIVLLLKKKKNNSVVLEKTVNERMEG